MQNRDFNEQDNRIEQTLLGIQEPREPAKVHHHGLPLWTLLDKYWAYDLDPERYKFLDWRVEIPRLCRKYWWNPLWLVWSLVCLVVKTWWILHWLDTLGMPLENPSLEHRLFLKIEPIYDHLIAPYKNWRFRRLKRTFEAQQRKRQSREER